MIHFSGNQEKQCPLFECWKKSRINISTMSGVPPSYQGAGKAPAGGMMNYFSVLHNIDSVAVIILVAIILCLQLSSEVLPVKALLQVLMQADLILTENKEAVTLSWGFLKRRERGGRRRREQRDRRKMPACHVVLVLFASICQHHV